MAHAAGARAALLERQGPTWVGHPAGAALESAPGRVVPTLDDSPKRDRGPS